MIENKEQLQDYLLADKKALGIKRKRPKILSDEIWRYERILRYTEYYSNKRMRIQSAIHRYRLKQLSVKYGFSIPLNVFDAGLAIVHLGPVIVSPYAKVGKNCRIQAMTVIGATNGETRAPVIGDNVYISTGAKLIGNISIADGTAIGAGAVVVKSIQEKNITVGGVPAKKISDNSSAIHLQNIR